MYGIDEPKKSCAVIDAAGAENSVLIVPALCLMLKASDSVTAKAIMTDL